LENVNSDTKKTATENVSVWPSMLSGIGAKEVVATITCKKCKQPDEIPAKVYRNIFTKRYHMMMPKIRDKSRMGNLSCAPETAEMWMDEKERIIAEYVNLKSQLDSSEDNSERAAIKRSMLDIMERKKPNLMYVEKMLKKMVGPVVINHCHVCRKEKRDERDLRAETYHMTGEEADSYKKELENKGYIDSLKKLKGLSFNE
jgi:hypothetical protein